MDFFNSAFRNKHAVQIALSKLRQYLEVNRTNSDVLISWGNTNLNPRFYPDILQLAAEFHRPVRFIRW